MSADGQRWFLVNASPDLAAQLASAPMFHPSTGRNSLVESILITNADLDHVLGLFLLREGGGIAVQATPAVRETLTAGLRLEAVMQAFGGVLWGELSEVSRPLRDRRGDRVGLTCRAIFLPGGPPPYAPLSPHPAGHSVALEITDDRSGGRLLVAPDLAEATASFRSALATADAVLIDGTFWSEDELAQIRPGARSAAAMGHLPVSSGTLELMRTTPARFKAYVHLNNTNPILLPGTPERAAVEAAGVLIGEDGWQCEL